MRSLWFWVSNSRDNNITIPEKYKEEVEAIVWWRENNNGDELGYSSTSLVGIIKLNRTQRVGFITKIIPDMYSYGVPSSYESALEYFDYKHPDVIAGPWTLGDIETIKKPRCLTSNTESKQFELIKEMVAEGLSINDIFIKDAVLATKWESYILVLIEERDKMLTKRKR